MATEWRQPSEDCKGNFRRQCGPLYSTHGAYPRHSREGREGRKTKGVVEPLLFFGRYALRPAKEALLCCRGKGSREGGLLKGSNKEGGGRKKKKQRALKLLNESRCFKGWFFASLWFLVDFKNISFKKEIGPVNFFFFFFLS